MHTKRPLATKKELLGLATLVAIIAAFFVTPLASAVGAVANEYVFNPDKLDPYKGLRPGIDVTVQELAESSPEVVNPYEWHDAYSFQVTNDGGLTLGKLEIESSFTPAVAKSQANTIWVRIEQGGELIMPETRLSDMKRADLFVPPTGFKPGEKIDFLVQLKIDQHLSRQGAYQQPTTFKFAVLESMHFKPGQDHFVPHTYRVMNWVGKDTDGL